MERNDAAVWVVGFGENRVFDGAGEYKERYIHGGGGGIDGYTLDSGGKSEVAEVELYRCCHAAKVLRPGCRAKDSRGRRGQGIAILYNPHLSSAQRWKASRSEGDSI